MNGLVMIFGSVGKIGAYILHLKVGCSDFGTVQDRGSLPYPTYLAQLIWPNSTNKVPRSL